MKNRKAVLGTLMILFFAKTACATELVGQVDMNRAKAVSPPIADVICLGSIGTYVDGEIIVRTVGVFFRHVPGAVVYNIYRKTDDQGEYVPIGSILDDQAHYVDSSVREKHSYMYRVTFLSRPEFKESSPGTPAVIELPDPKDVKINWGPTSPGRGSFGLWNNIKHCEGVIARGSESREVWK